MARAKVAPVRQAVPDVERNEALTGPGVPQAGASGHVGRRGPVLEELLARRRRRPLPVAAIAERPTIAASAAATSRLVGPTIVLGAVEVEPASVPGPEAASSVPLRRPVPARLATAPTEQAPTGLRTGPTRAPRAGTCSATTAVPVVVLAAAATATSPALPSATSRRPTQPIVAKAHPGALRPARIAIRAATANTVSATAALTPTRVALLRGVAPTAKPMSTSIAPSVAATATASRPRAATQRAIGSPAAIAALRAAALERLPLTARRRDLATLAAVRPDAIAVVPKALPTPSPDVAAIAVDAVGLLGPAITGPVPVGEARPIAAKLAVGLGLVALRAPMPVPSSASLHF